MNRNMIVALALVMLGVPAGASAQQDPDCSYSTCALRIEASSGFFSKLKVMRGWPGEEVADADRSPELQALLTEVDSAGAFYFRFAEHDRRADRWGLVGGLATVAGYALSHFGRNDTVESIGTGLLLGGSVTGVIGAIAGRKASRDLRRSLWWYNAALAGEPGVPRSVP